MALFLLGMFSVTMVAAAGFVVEKVFGALGLIPTGPRDAKVVEAHVARNHTTVLNIVSIALAALLLWRFLPSVASARCG